MSRSFAIALLAPALAFARGDDSGFGRENAIETVLLTSERGDNLKLFTYNALNGDVAEIHGDLELSFDTFADASPLELQKRYRSFGWCVEMATDSWDCMEVSTDLL